MAVDLGDQASLPCRQRRVLAVKGTALLFIAPVWTEPR